MLAIEDIHHHYGHSQSLWGASFNLQEGECTCLIGRNGVGKTTLLECIIGLEELSQGHILFKGNTLAAANVEQRAALGIGYVPQGRQIFPLLTVEENLRVGLVNRPELNGKIPGLVFELFPVLKQMLARRGGDLSGGQQQQLAIGRALVINPALLILDEPTEGIQPNIVHQIGDIILELNRTLKMTVLLVEQKLPFVHRVADRFVIMDKGRIVAGDEMKKLDDNLVQRYLTV